MALCWATPAWSWSDAGKKLARLKPLLWKTANCGVPFPFMIFLLHFLWSFVVENLFLLGSQPGPLLGPQRQRRAGLTPLSLPRAVHEHKALLPYGLSRDQPVAGCYRQHPWSSVRRVQHWEPRRSSPRPASRPGTCCLLHMDCVYAAGASVCAGSGESPFIFFGRAFSCLWVSEACAICPERCPLLSAGWKERGCSKTFIPHSLYINKFISRLLESLNLLAKKPY